MRAVFFVWFEFEGSELEPRTSANELLLQHSSSLSDQDMNRSGSLPDQRGRGGRREPAQGPPRPGGRLSHWHILADFGKFKLCGGSCSMMALYLTDN